MSSQQKHPSLVWHLTKDELLALGDNHELHLTTDDVPLSKCYKTILVKNLKGTDTSVQVAGVRAFYVYTRLLIFGVSQKMLHILYS